VPDAHLTDAVRGDGVRAGLGIGPDAVVVGTVTTLNDYEGVDVLLEAAALLDDPRVVVLVVGDGPARDRLAAHANRLSVRGTRTRVILTGRVPHARSRDHHAAIDVFCLPRRSTAVTALVPPLKPVEAMALARPVVASDLPPLRELVGPNRGLLVPAGDASALADALDLLAGDPGLRARLGRAARDHVASERTWSAAARTYQHIYDSVCEGA
jgi:glycosyltransferase involved in cell wall biosynthesis